MVPAVQLCVWIVVLNERTNFCFPYRMAAFCEQGSSSCCGRLSGKQNARILQASPLTHRLLVCTQTQAEEASFIPDLVGSHLVLVTSAESYHGLHLYVYLHVLITASARRVCQSAKSYRFGMDALVTACFRNTNLIIVLAWMLW